MKRFMARHQQTVISHHGFTPQTPPVLQAQDAATRLITHVTFSRDRQVPLQPLVRHRHLETGGSEVSGEAFTDSVKSQEKLSPRLRPR